MKLNHPQDPNCTLEAIQNDVDAAIKNGLISSWAFTPLTAQCLIDKIKEPEDNLTLLIK